MNKETESLMPPTPPVRIAPSTGFGAASPAMKTTAEIGLTAMYEAFIGPAKAHYYVPVFGRFDAGASAFSWNWPAAFITQLWMLFRGMFLWGFLWYPILGFLTSLLVVVHS